MSNLQIHIASLEALIDKANALPTEKKIQETKTVTPSTSSQTVQPDSGYDGLGKVTVNAMPTGSVGTPSINIDANGKITATAAVDAGYVDGTDKTGTKTMTTQAAKTVTPTKSSQTAVAKNVYTTGVVTVGAIPDKYQDVSGVTATAAGTLSGQKFVNTSGTLTTGTMPNNGSMSKTIDGLNTKSATIPAGYTTGGTVSLDSTIDNTANAQAAKIAEIAALLEGKSVGGGTSGGGSAPDTCTMEIGYVSFHPSYLVTCYSEGEIYTVSSYISNYYGDTIVIENVVCGSIIATTSPSAVTGATYLCHMLDTLGHEISISLYQITASAGETVSFMYG